MPNPVIHFEVTGRDGKKLQDFFANAFGWKIDSNNPMNYGIVEAQGNGIGGGIGPTPEGAGQVTFYIEVDNPTAYLQKIEGLGGKTVMPEMEIPGDVTIAMFADPEGHVIGLVKDGSM